MHMDINQAYTPLYVSYNDAKVLNLFFRMIEHTRRLRLPKTDCMYTP